MHIAFLNIQGNFDPEDRYWTAHPDFGGQLVYVKEVTLALGRMGHQVDIIVAAGATGLEPTSVLDLSGGTVEVVRAGRGDISQFA